MKKHYSIILAVIATLAFAPTVSAQGDIVTIDDFIKSKYGSSASMTFPKDNGVIVSEEKSFGYSKNISSPFSDGTYWIKLESFATGSAKLTDKPSDIVLVLDYSNSMALGYPEDRTKDALFTAQAVTNYTGQNSADNGAIGINNHVFFYKFQGKYYQVSFGGNAAGQGRHLTFTTDEGVVYYLNNYGDTSQPGLSTTRPTQPQSNNTTYWRGQLYTYNGTQTRLSALKDAVDAFMQEIYHNDNYVGDTDDKPRAHPLGNRISVVSFSGQSYSSTGAHIMATAQSLVMSGTRSGWYNISTSDGAVNYTTLLNAVKAESNHAGTYSDYGMKLANDLLATIDAADPERKNNSNRTVVFFTDGVPGGQWIWSETGSTPTANACIEQAKTTKNTRGATVFSVALWQGGFSNSGGQQMLKYLNYTSSNYPQATNLTTPGTALPEDERIYTMEAGDDLSAVFRAIAKMSGGSSASLGASTSNMDVISDSFILPDGTTSANIGDRVKVFTAPLTSIDADGNYVFGTETIAGKATDTYDILDDEGNVLGTYKVDEVPNPNGTTPATLPIKVELVGTNGVKVTNFDYSNNWCGPVEDQAGEVTYHGHKIIVLIPIQMNPDAVGGPNVETNGDGSGIFSYPGDTTPYIDFKSPTVNLPVNIYIEKVGITGRESARFLIERAVVPESGNIDDIAPEAWEYVTTVFVTNSPNAKRTEAGNPMVRVRGLPSNDDNDKGFIYRVSEENWSWSYTGTTPPQYTDTNHLENPFTFENEKKDRIDVLIRHAESKITNVFKEGVENKVIDDSKTNTD